MDMFLAPSKAPSEVDKETGGGFALTFIGIVADTAAASGESGSENCVELSVIEKIILVNPAFDN